MTSSYVEYRGNGFWSWDGYLDDTLLLLERAGEQNGSPRWLLEVLQKWVERAPLYGCWVTPGLDELLTTDERRQFFVQTAKPVLARTDLTVEAEKTIEMLICLLDGQIKTGVASPFDYMVRGEHPYKPTITRAR